MLRLSSRYYRQLVKNILGSFLFCVLIFLLSVSMYAEFSRDSLISEVISDSGDKPSLENLEDQGEDVLITVKTTKKNHWTRVNEIAETWFDFAPKKIYFITDSEDEKLNNLTGGRLVVTRCPPGHQRQALCCKQEAEYETYIKSGKSWWCHFDDDNYVNVPQLMLTLGEYDPSEDWYLGRPSTKRPIDAALIKIDQRSETESHRSNKDKFAFWFATGGAGFCLSKSLATKMSSYAMGGKFEALCDRIRLPDDVTLGYLIGYLLDRNLTVVPTFHSHLEDVQWIPADRLKVQVSFGAYKKMGQDQINVESPFSKEERNSELKNIHCYLYPLSNICLGTEKRK